ncbi:MAG: GNAT family N-acetyltransferase [Anaerolineae bacterium]|nr:GNAT family N-acetyltransferase [Anaerolineae bacterium]
MKPLFEGQLVRLAAPQAADQAVFAKWTENDEYMRLLDDDPIQPQAPDRIQFGGSDTSFYFHVRTLAEDTLIGFVVLFNIKWSNQSAMLAIGIGETAFRGKGYGSDALGLILNYAFNELNLYRVGLTVMNYNTAAIRAYEKAGFVREGAARQAVQREGQRYDLVYYGILREEWNL